MSDWVYVGIGAAPMLWLGFSAVFVLLGWTLRRWRAEDQAI